jgi:hypothetical protein
MGKCTCLAGGSNLGKSNCDPILQSANRFLFKEKVNADGSTPSIDFSPSPFTESDWETYTQATPLRNRYLLAVNVDDYEAEQAEAEEVETANAINYKVRDGVTEVTYHLYDATFKQYDKFKSLECLNLGINIVDDAGQVAGKYLTDDELGLIPIESFRVRKQMTTNSGNVSHLIITFRIPHTFNLGEIAIYKPADVDFSALDLLAISDLIATDLVATDASAIVTVNVGNDSTLLGFDPYIGLIDTNFTITVNGSPAVIDDVTETADGEYSIELDAPVTNGDTVSLTAIDVNGAELLAPVTVTV